MIVRMFKPRFAPLVESGEKLQTIRPTPKRMPCVGQSISLRAWTGKPYRSKQRILRESLIVAVHPIEINEDGPVVDGVPFIGWEQKLFAQNDGFKDWPDMRQWFEETHGLPFKGILICWDHHEQAASREVLKGDAA